MLNKFFEGIGRFILDGLWFIGDVILLLGEALRQMPKKIRWNHVLAQMAHLGVDSLPIVLLTLLFTGMVLTMQIAHEFIRFGAQSAIGGVVAIGIGRELGPVLVGVVAAGRVGSAMTAEISTMKVTEQIDALKVMATNPVGYLVVPRMIACMLTLPLLTAFGDLIGVLGGWVVSTYYAHVNSVVFWNSIEKFAVIYDLTGGIIKSVFFGGAIAVLGCYYGMRAPEGAEGVGKATTRSVVTSIIIIFFTNVILSWVLF